MPCTMPPHLWLLRILGPFCEEPHTGNFMRLIREYLLVSFPKETYLEYRQSASKRQDEGSSFSRNLAPHSTASRVSAPRGPGLGSCWRTSPSAAFRKY